MMLNSINWNTNDTSVLQIKDYKFDRICNYLLCNPYHSLYMQNTNGDYIEIRLNNYKSFVDAFSLDGDFDEIDLSFVVRETGEECCFNKNNIPDMLFYKGHNKDTGANGMIPLF